MTPNEWTRIKTIFDAVVLIGKDERSLYLRQACAGDDDLRREVKALLSSYDDADDFMEKPLAGEVAGLLKTQNAQEFEPGYLFNRYKIIRKIGTGGMGKVYLAEDTQLKRSVALKLLSAEATVDAGQVARFVQEARLASLLNHPNILTIYEIGQTGSLHFISTEFVSGRTLRSRLSRGPLATKDAINIAIDIASALAVAHKCDIVHRDIKPENVMMRDDGLLKVLDFGLAKLNRNERPFGTEQTDATWNNVRTEPGLILGTVTYMSPEQASGIEVDARTDIWSLGVVLYEMISGKAPFSGSSAADIVNRILKLEPEPIQEFASELRPRLTKIINRSLAKSVDDRYQTIEEMLGDLRDLRVEIETGVAGPSSVAILPFINITRDERLNFFEFALADAVITELARSHSLVVRPSSSVAKYLGKEVDPISIGAELKVDAVLAANFLLSKERIRVTTQLIDVAGRNVLWSEQIDSTTDDIIGLQDTITKRIVEGLKCELETSVHPSAAVTGNSVAYIEYLRGRDQLRRFMFHTVANKNVEIAIRHFTQAIDLDPKFALAYSALGTCYLQKVIKVVGTRDDIEKAAAAFARAIELDSRLVDARAYRALIARLQGETQKSRDELAALRRDEPNNFEVLYMSGACYRYDGDYENALRCYEEMLRIDPTAEVSVHYCRARIFWYRGNFDKAYEELEFAREIEPNHPVIKFFHAIITFLSGDPAGAIEELRIALSICPCKAFQTFLAMCFSALGRFEAAQLAITEECERIAEVDPDVSYWLASAKLMAGHTDEALHWLECSVNLGNHNRKLFETDPIWTPMNDDPRYREVVSRLTSPHF